MFAVAHADEYRSGCGIGRQGSDQCVARAQALVVRQGAKDRAAIFTETDLYRVTVVAGRGLDGADCGRNARAESRPRKICLG